MLLWWGTCKVSSESLMVVLRATLRKQIYMKQNRLAVLYPQSMPAHLRTYTRSRVLARVSVYIYICLSICITCVCSDLYQTSFTAYIHHGAHDTSPFIFSFLFLLLFPFPFLIPFPSFFSFLSFIFSSPSSFTFRFHFLSHSLLLFSQVKAAVPVSLFHILLSIICIFFPSFPLM